MKIVCDASNDGIISKRVSCEALYDSFGKLTAICVCTCKRNKSHWNSGLFLFYSK